MKQVKIRVCKGFSPFQRTFDISPQFIAGRAIADGTKSEAYLQSLQPLSSIIFLEIIVSRKSKPTNLELVDSEPSQSLADFG